MSADKKYLYDETRAKINHATISSDKKMALIYVLEEQMKTTQTYFDFMKETQNVLERLLLYELEDDRSSMN